MTPKTPWTAEEIVTALANANPNLPVSPLVNRARECVAYRKPDAQRLSNKCPSCNASVISVHHWEYFPSERHKRTDSGHGESADYDCGAQYEWDSKAGEKIREFCPQSDGGAKAKQRRDAIDLAVADALRGMGATNAECHEFERRMGDGRGMLAREGIWALLPPVEGSKT